MAVTFVSNALGATNTTTSFSINLPATQAGDIIILEYGHRGTADATIGGTYSGPAFAEKHDQQFASSTFSGKTLWSRATGNHTGQTVTGSGLTDSCAAIITIYRGAVANGDPLRDATVVGEQNASGNETQAEIVTTTPGAWVVLVVVNSPDLAVSTQSSTSPGTLNERAEVLSTGGTDFSIAHASAEKASIGGTGALTWAQTNAASGSWAYAIRPDQPLDAAGALSITGAAVMNAVGALLAAGSLAIAGAADLDARGSLAAVGSVAISGAADLVAGVTQDVAATGSLSITGVADLDAVGSLVAAGSLSITGAGDLDAIGKLEAAGGIALAGVADLDARGSLAAAGTCSITGFADLTEPAGNNLLAVGALSLTGSATLTATGGIAAAGSVSIAGVADLDAVGTLSAAGLLGISGAAELEAIGELAAAGGLSIAGAATLVDANAVPSAMSAGRIAKANRTNRTAKAERRNTTTRAQGRVTVSKVTGES